MLIVLVMDYIFMLNWLSNIEICMVYRDDILEVETLGKRHESCAEWKVDNNYF